MLQKVLFSCVHAIFSVFKYTVSPAENNSRYSLFFKHICNSVRFSLNVARDEFGLKRRKTSPIANPAINCKCNCCQVNRFLGKAAVSILSESLQLPPHN